MPLGSGIRISRNEHSARRLGCSRVGFFHGQAAGGANMSIPGGKLNLGDMKAKTGVLAASLDCCGQRLVCAVVENKNNRQASGGMPDPRLLAECFQENGQPPFLVAHRYGN
jgi:hypothetical protein